MCGELSVGEARAGEVFGDEGSVAGVAVFHLDVSGEEGNWRGRGGWGVEGDIGHWIRPGPWRRGLVC